MIFCSLQENRMRKLKTNYESNNFEQFNGIFIYLGFYFSANKKIIFRNKLCIY